MIKKGFAFALTLLLLVMVSGCGWFGGEDPPPTLEELRLLYGPNYHPENETANQDYLYGIGHIAYSNYRWYGIDYTITTELFVSLGVRSVRNWMHILWLLNDPVTPNAENVAVMRDIVDHLVAQDFQIIGMNHSSFLPPGYANSHRTVAKPPRDLTEGSLYMRWLEDYRTSWETLVSLFPEITYWEIDNESNYDPFFPNLMGGTFTLREKAAIYTDMLYFASEGIRAGNPDAITVMGGLVSSTAEAFLEMIYANIAAEDSWSPYPDDYFQVAAWHPYMNNFNKAGFIRLNQEIYQVILDHEGKDKKVFLTEMGWSEYALSIDVIDRHIRDLFAAIEESLPFIESVHYFRMYDNWLSTWGSPAERQFGLFTDPTDHGPNHVNAVLASPKILAYTFQELAGGVGSLTLYRDRLLGEETP